MLSPSMSSGAVIYIEFELESVFLTVAIFHVAGVINVRVIGPLVESTKYRFHAVIFPLVAIGPIIGIVPPQLIPASSSIASWTLFAESPLVVLLYHTSNASWSGVGTRTAIVQFIA